tara:strand:+ start:888 stop:1007 length:120 start_codon:yes stop_codon:yes gene_type:complete
MRDIDPEENNYFVKDSYDKNRLENKEIIQKIGDMGQDNS